MLNTTAGATDVLGPADLGPLGGLLGRGGEARVYAVPALTLPDVPGPLAYKRYARPQPTRRGLATLVATRAALPPAARARLDAVACWPVRRVVESGSVRGIVMPLIPEAMTLEVPQRAGGVARVPQDLQGLLITEEHARAAGRPTANLDTRLRVARAAAAAMAFLHDEMDVVLGDVSPRTTLVDPRGPQRVVFLDCDAMRPASVPPDHRQLHTPDWAPPGGGPASRATDLYKLGLLVLRVLHAPRSFASVVTDPSQLVRGLDHAGLALLHRAVGPHRDPVDPPAARCWVRQLTHALGEAVRPPRLHGVTVEPGVVVPGGRTRVRWTLDEPALVEIRQDGAVLAAVRAGPGAGGLDVTPRRSGALEVTAVNFWGPAPGALRPVMVLSPPERSGVPVPVPRIELPWFGVLPAPVVPPLPVGAMTATGTPPLLRTPPPEAPILRPDHPDARSSPTLPPAPLPEPPTGLLDLVTSMPESDLPSDRERARQ